MSSSASHALGHTSIEQVYIPLSFIVIHNAPYFINISYVAINQRYYLFYAVAVFDIHAWNPKSPLHRIKVSDFRLLTSHNMSIRGPASLVGRRLPQGRRCLLNRMPGQSTVVY